MKDAVSGALSRYRMTKMALLMFVCVVTAGASAGGSRQLPCPAVSGPNDDDGSRAIMVLGGRMALIKCGLMHQVTVCLNGRWSSSSACFKKISNQENAGRKLIRRPKRSPNTGKYEALRKRVKVQRKIRQGLLATTIDPSTPSVVRVRAGGDAFLLCRVQNVGAHSVTWSRLRDRRVIAIDTSVLVSDARLSPSFEEQTGTWFLRVTRVRKFDEGNYECQVSTRPPLKKVVTLQVIPRGQPLDAVEVQGKLSIKLSSVD